MLTSPLILLREIGQHVNLYGCNTDTHTEKPISTLIAFLLPPTLLFSTSPHPFRLIRHQETQQKPALQHHSTARYFRGIRREYE